MAAGPWTYYGSFLEKLGNKVIDLDADTFKLYLAGSGYSPDASAHDEVADLSAEASNYTRPTLDTVAWTRSGTSLKWDSDDEEILVSGGALVARYAVIYDDTPAGDPLVAYCLLDTTPADVSVADGNSLIVRMNAAGIITMQPA